MNDSKTFHRNKLKALFSAVVIALTATVASAEDASGDVEPLKYQKQTSQDAFNGDVSILAQEKGVDEESIARAIQFQDNFVFQAHSIIEKYPDKVSRVWVEPAPSQMGHIEFVGQVPSIRFPANVSVSGGAKLTLREHKQRAELIADVLKRVGQKNFMTYFDARSGKVNIEMAMPSPAKGPSKSQLLGMIQSGALLLADVPVSVKNITQDDIDINIIQSEGEIYNFDHSRGGNWLRDDGTRECTSGWAVSGPNGDGIVTAAHCTGLNQFEESTSTIYSMTWRSQERGNGDAEYHTTTHIEPAEFWATSSSLRDVNGIRTTGSMTAGTSVCEYGRSSNTRTCNHEVIATNVTATFSDGVTVSNLVRVTGDNSIGGDSGGGWSFGNTAWGVHSGSNGSTSLFTPVQRVQTELNVTIKTQ